MIATTAVRGVVRLPATVAEAQALIEAHIDSAPYTGRCVGCKEVAPRRARELAYVAFQQLGALPVRKRRLLRLGIG